MATTTRKKLELKRRTMRRKLDSLRGLHDEARRRWSAQDWDEASAVIEEIEERAGALVNFIADYMDPHLDDDDAPECRARGGGGACVFNGQSECRYCGDDREGT